MVIIFRYPAKEAQVISVELQTKAPQSIAGLLLCPELQMLLLTTSTAHIEIVASVTKKDHFRKRVD
jgi:hypothetical protein